MAAEILRGEAAALLTRVAPQAFLRWSRGSGLLMTNAPRLGALPSALVPDGGTIAVLENGLAELSPGPERLAALEREAGPGGPLSRSFDRFRGREMRAEDLSIVLEAIKASTGHADASACEKRLRQRAAVVLRTGAGGGGLWLAARSLEAGTEESRAR